MKMKSIRLKRKGVEIFLSPLESDILNVLWKGESSRVRDIYNVLKKRRKIALTSVAVSLDRLHKKSIVGRKISTGRGGPHYIYYTKKSKDDFVKSIIGTAVDKLIDNFGSTAVTYFNERFSAKKPRRS